MHRYTHFLNEIIFSFMQELCGTKRERKLVLDLTQRGKSWRSQEHAIDMKIYENEKCAAYSSEWPS